MSKKSSKEAYGGMIEDKYLDLLKQEAKEEDRPLSYVINRIIKKFCEKEEKHEGTR